MDDDIKETRLRGIIRGCGSLAVAFSGGVDSSLLCAIAAAELGDRALAVTVVSPMLPRSELESARALASALGIRHVLVEDGEIEEAVARNPADRCYHCKNIEFAHIRRAAAELGIDTVAEGSNLDDLSDYRPGAAATRELGIRSPLKEAGLTKAEIRAISKRLSLPTWDKPAFACLASRVPYGERIDAAKLARVESSEDYLRGLGFRQFRVRSHGDIARIELARDERSKLFREELMDAVSARLKSFGFVYVCLELEGYAMGSMNRVIAREGVDA
jgi:uncharacterized protein